MKRSLIVACILLWTMGAASAQIPAPGRSIWDPPVPQPPPPPRIEVPAIPKMDAPTQPSLRSRPRSSFGDRISRCLDEAAAAGLNQGERAAYSRSCANHRD